MIKEGCMGVVHMHKCACILVCIKVHKPQHTCVSMHELKKTKNKTKWPHRPRRIMWRVTWERSCIILLYRIVCKHVYNIIVLYVCILQEVLLLVGFAQFHFELTQSLRFFLQHPARWQQANTEKQEAICMKEKQHNPPIHTIHTHTPLSGGANGQMTTTQHAKRCVIIYSLFKLR